jgi:hypothetical protein
MLRSLRFFLFALFAFFQSGALLAGSSDAQSELASAQAVAPDLQACPAQVVQGRIDLAQVAQTDCCKGHKGVCGCRAGKIVCCDNTVSPTCTCHSDWLEANY